MNFVYDLGGAAVSGIGLNNAINEVNKTGKLINKIDAGVQAVSGANSAKNGVEKYNSTNN